ncbi:MAG: hypothetical protein AAF400_01315 [Bacteroidota bacterium]
MLERTGNTRALYVKLADRLHNVHTVCGHSKPEKRQKIAKETIEFLYTPGRAFEATAGYNRA